MIYLRQDKIERRAYEQREKAIRDYYSYMNAFKEKIAKISELAVGDACTGSNPRPIDPAAMEKLFNCTYYGTEVDF